MCKITNSYVGFDDVTEMGMKRFSIWDITQCSPLIISRYSVGEFLLNL
jgi:hypothetical protein